MYCLEDIPSRKAEIVRKIISERLLTIAFQPIWDISSTRPLGFEALARPFSQLALSGPDEAFDIAERIGQVPELDQLCIRKVIEAVPNVPSGSTIFVNMSPESLSHRSFSPTAFVDSMRAAGVRPQQIVIEITERRIDEPTTIIQRAKVLRDLGVRIALDDVGLGDAALELCTKLDVDFLKIDRMLLVRAVSERGARGVLVGLIAIARATGTYLIAEGVENTSMLEFVAKAYAGAGAESQGIRGVQGYLLGRPEIGCVDLRSLEEHHRYLEGRRFRSATRTVRHRRGSLRGRARPGRTSRSGSARRPLLRETERMVRRSHAGLSRALTRIRPSRTSCGSVLRTSTS